MSAYAICDVEIYDLERYQDFLSEIKPALESAGGRFLVRGGVHEVLEGEWEPRRLVLIEFPSIEKAEEFYHSEQYQKHKINREHWNWDCVFVVEGI